jgi:hypothetical protein
VLCVVCAAVVRIIVVKMIAGKRSCFARLTRSYRLDPIAGRDERRPLDHLAKMVPAALSLGGWGRCRDRLFGEEHRQDSILVEGVKHHAGAVTARVG